MAKIKGFLRVAPFAGTFLMAGTFALVGTPPSSIFLSELLIIKASVAAGRLVPLAILLVMLLVRNNFV